MCRTDLGTARGGGGGTHFEVKMGLEPPYSSMSTEVWGEGSLPATALNYELAESRTPEIHRQRDLPQLIQGWKF